MGQPERAGDKWCCTVRQENIEFKYMNDRGDTSIRRHPFEGVLHNMERRYKDGIQRGTRRISQVYQ